MAMRAFFTGSPWQAGGQWRAGARMGRGGYTSQLPERDMRRLCRARRLTYQQGEGTGDAMSVRSSLVCLALLAGAGSRGAGSG